MSSIQSITLIPGGGLGNRLRAVLSAYKLALETGRHLRVVWPLEPGLMARWDHLYEALPGVEFFHLPWPYARRDALRSPWLWTGQHRLDCILRRAMRWAFFDYVAEVEILSNRAILNQPSAVAFQRSRKALILAYGWIHPLEASDYRVLRPKQPGSDLVARNLQRAGRPLIGLHIRRTDHIDAQRLSPVAHFKASIQAEIQADPNVSFWLASDDASLRSELAEAFGPRFLWQEAPLQRNSLEGMLAAVVELHTLACCDKVIGSCGSTFSMVAADIGNKPLYWPCDDGSLRIGRF